MSESCIIFVANRAYALVSSRLSLIHTLRDAGWSVVAVTAPDEYAPSLEEVGCEIIPVVFNRGGLSLRGDWAVYRTLRRVYRKYRPKLIHHFHAKPVILGSLAARRVLGDSVRVVNTITGLGYAFITGGITARLVGMGYRVALLRTDATIFQNRDDRALFLERGWVSEARPWLIASSGVDVESFRFVDRTARDGSAPTVVMLGRLLAQKGIPEFAEVACRVRRQWPGARFLLAGEEDPVHPDALSSEWIHSQSDIEYLGRLPDVGPLLEQADLLLFPSYYREGVPRVVMEAAATGLPTVAFDVPGVREAVRDQETGFLVPDRNVDALTAQVEVLLGDAELRERMGRAARRLAEEAFDIRTIQAQHLALYRKLGLEVS